LGKTSFERLMLETYSRLRRWRLYIPAVAKAARDLLGPNTKVYVAGGAAENRLTVLSDIDVVIVSDKIPGNEKAKLRLRLDIRDLAVSRYGLPWDYPVDIHLYNTEEFREARKKYRKLVEIEP
jgi:predicted nucleotidyltransferase